MPSTNTSHTILHLPLIWLSTPILFQYNLLFLLNMYILISWSSAQGLVNLVTLLNGYGQACEIRGQSASCLASSPGPHCSMTPSAGRAPKSLYPLWGCRNWSLIVLHQSSSLTNQAKHHGRGHLRAPSQELILSCLILDVSNPAILSRHLSRSVFSSSWHGVGKGKGKFSFRPRGESLWMPPAHWGLPQRRLTLLLQWVFRDPEYLARSPMLDNKTYIYDDNSQTSYKFLSWLLHPWFIDLL